MSVFLAIFFGTYGAMNAYLLWTLYRGLGGHLYRWIAPALFVMAMVMAPLALRATERSWPLPAARTVHLIVWTWVALVFWGDCMAFLLDLYNGLVWCALHLRPTLRLSGCPYRVFPYILGGGWLLLLAWGLWEGNRVELRTVQFATAKLPPEAPALRLLQVSDLHLGMTVRHRRQQKVLDLVHEVQPDILVATGDFIDGAGPHMDELMTAWQQVTPPLGKYAIIGNHEVYPGLERSIELLRMGGFHVLRGQTVPIGTHWLLAGIDDPAVHYRGGKEPITERQLLPNPTPDRFVILLKHQPRVDENSLQTIDLQLSGHTHGGQIFPFGLVVGLHYPYPYAQLLRLSDHMRLYVSRGAGLWGPPLRVLAPADVTLFVIGPASDRPSSGN